MVEAGLRPLGEEYISHLKEGFTNGWIDVYENQGKPAAHIHGEHTQRIHMSS